jgi:single-strand DNA-binding protein
MLGLNNIQIIGNLGGTPDLKFLNDGKSQVVNFSVAVNERWKNRDGDPQERTTWLRVVAFNGIGQACAEHLTKGDGVYVEGRLQVREYEDKDGNERTSVEVVAGKVRFLGRGNNNGDEKRSTPGQPRAKTEQPSASPGEFDQSGADDVPF